MAVVTQAQPTFIVNTASEIDTSWPDGSIVFVVYTKKKYFISGGASYTPTTEYMSTTSRVAIRIYPWGTEGSATGEIRFFEQVSSGSNQITFKAPSSILNDTVLILPDYPGTSGQVLGTLGAGASGTPLYWASVQPQPIESRQSDPVAPSAGQIWLRTDIA